MSVELKIKAKHLALEPAIIRAEERKLAKQISWFSRQGELTAEQRKELGNIHCKRNSLYTHRITDVRRESRATGLARAYIKGTPYARVERRDVTSDERWVKEYEFKNRILPRVLTMVQKYYHTKTTMDDIVTWINATPNA